MRDTAQAYLQKSFSYDLRVADISSTEPPGCVPHTECVQSLCVLLNNNINYIYVRNDLYMASKRSLIL